MWGGTSPWNQVNTAICKFKDIVGKRTYEYSLIIYQSNPEMRCLIIRGLGFWSSFLMGAWGQKKTPASLTSLIENIKNSSKIIWYSLLQQQGIVLHIQSPPSLISYVFCEWIVTVFSSERHTIKSLCSKLCLSVNCQVQIWLKFKSLKAEILQPCTLVLKIYTVAIV